MKKLIFIFLLLALQVSITLGQKTKPWVEWTKEDAEKTLNDSAWGQTQTETDTSEMFYTPTKQGTSSIAMPSTTTGKISDQQSINNNRADRGATNQAISVNYRIAFLSARPIREAISRMIVLRGDQHVEALENLMQTFVDRDFSQYIVLTVTFDSIDGRFTGPAMQAFASATTDTLKTATYLERKDGKRLYIMEYRAPQNDGLGAKFVFPREVDGKPFLTAENGYVRFYSEVGKTKLNVKYQLAKMLIDGKLEY